MGLFGKSIDLGKHKVVRVTEETFHLGDVLPRALDGTSTVPAKPENVETSHFIEKGV